MLSKVTTIPLKLTESAVSGYLEAPEDECGSESAMLELAEGSWEV